MNWLAEEVLRQTSAAGVDPLRVKEAARRALPEATDRVNELWRTLLDTPKGDPNREAVSEAHLQAAIDHSALLELAA